MVSLNSRVIRDCLGRSSPQTSRHCFFPNLSLDLRLIKTWLRGVDWGKFSYKMTKMIAENIKDPSLREWVLPCFTTTTKIDQSVAAILLMSTLQKYFVYSSGVCCGLPSVTLLGQKSDWEKIVTKAERLLTFGEETETWYGLLKPVLDNFVSSFDHPEAPETIEFWSKIVHYQGGSGMSYLSVSFSTFVLRDIHLT